MKIRSYFINIRPRWSMLPRLWNKFFSNLEKDYKNFYKEIKSSDIHDSEANLQNNIGNFLSIKTGNKGWFKSGWFKAGWFSL